MFSDIFLFFLFNEEVLNRVKNQSKTMISKESQLSTKVNILVMRFLTKNTITKNIAHRPLKLNKNMNQKYHRMKKSKKTFLKGLSIKQSLKMCIKRRSFNNTLSRPLELGMKSLPIINKSVHQTQGKEYKACYSH